MKLKTEKQRKINETKSQFFEKVNKLDKLLYRLTNQKERRHKLSISESETIIVDSADMERIIRECYK